MLQTVQWMLTWHLGVIHSALRSEKILRCPVAVVVHKATRPCLQARDPTVHGNLPVIGPGCCFWTLARAVHRVQVLCQVVDSGDSGTTNSWCFRRVLETFSSALFQSLKVLGRSSAYRAFCSWSCSVIDLLPDFRFSCFQSGLVDIFLNSSTPWPLQQLLHLFLSLSPMRW
jgi:hypothetical protein